MKFIPLVVITILLAGVFTSSCMHYPTAPPSDSTKCDTCCDTCHNPCDTCNLNRDSLSHAFEWTEYSIDGETSLTGCWILSPTDIRIMGNYYYKFDGTTFTKLSAYNLTRDREMGGGLNGFNIFGFDENDYWLISGNGSRAYHSVYDTQFDEFNPGNTNSCWGPSSNDIFVVGNSGQIHHFDGTKFTDMVSGTTKDLRSVSGTNHNNVWAAGFDESTAQSILLHYDGSTWSEIPLSSNPLNVYPGATGHALGYVWSTDSNGHKIVVPSGSLVWRRTDVGEWRSDTALLPNRLNGGGFIMVGALGNNINDFMAIGGWGFVAHWNGKTWKKYDELYNYGNPNYGPAAFSMKGNTACVVGTKSGQSWIAVGRRKQ